MNSFRFGKSIEVLVESPEMSFGSLNLNRVKKDLVNALTPAFRHVRACVHLHAFPHMRSRRCRVIALYLNRIYLSIYFYFFL